MFWAAIVSRERFEQRTAAASPRLSRRTHLFANVRLTAAWRSCSPDAAKPTPGMRADRTTCPGVAALIRATFRPDPNVIFPVSACAVRAPASRSKTVARLRGDLEGMQPRRVIKHLTGNHQLVGTSPLDEGGELCAHGIWRANGRTRQHV